MAKLDRREFISRSIKVVGGLTSLYFFNKDYNFNKPDLFSAAKVDSGVAASRERADTSNRDRMPNRDDEIQAIREKIEKTPRGLERFDHSSNIEEVYDAVKNISNKYDQLPQFKGNLVTSAYCDAITYPDGKEWCADQNIFERGWSVATYLPIIPKNYILFVENYGWCKAQDTGPAIDGNPRVIDLSLRDRDACYKWGERSVNVVAIPPGCLNITQVQRLKNSKLNQVEALENYILSEIAHNPTSRKDLLITAFNQIKEHIIS